MTAPNHRHWFDFLLDIWTSSRIGRAMSLLINSTLHFFHPSHYSTTNQYTKIHHVVDRKFSKSMDDFAVQVRALLEAPLQTSRLLDMSNRLREEYQHKLHTSHNSMLPSYVHTLPTGDEKGHVLALDVGGSTFRLALIQLLGRNDGLRVTTLRKHVIDDQIRALKGDEFFDWMADRIVELLAECHHMNGTVDAPLDMGLTWSFPIEQTSPRTGRLLPMGKGFFATHGVEGQDLSLLLTRACLKKKAKVELRAIVNDGDATLLSQAYRDPATCMSLILGTGTNAAVYLPVSALGRDKFGRRPDTWFAAAKHVVVNTELSMYGKYILPTTHWDDELNAKHILPDFQPLEYLSTGRYLGEIVRLILLDAVRTAGLFDGHIPEGMDQPYALDTRILATFETDTSPSLAAASRTFLQAHPLPLPPRFSELDFIRHVSQMISRRASVYLATALHALWMLRTNAEGLEPDTTSHVSIACHGTIVEKYPEFRARCQRQLDELCILSGSSKGAVTLELATESSIFGAAVAVSCIAGA